MSIKVWELATDCNKDLTIRTEIDYFQTHIVTESMLNQWNPPAIRIEGKTKRLRDFVSWMKAAPVVSQQARMVLEPLIKNHCEFLPLIQLRGKNYFALNVTTKIDCLDHRNSKIVYADNDPQHVLRISSYVFDAKRALFDIPIFKIPEEMGCVFVTKTFIDAILSYNLAGASFQDPAIDPLELIIQGKSLNVISGLPELRWL